MTDIQGKVTQIGDGLDANSEFSTDRYTLLFKPGAYKLDIPVGYYTQIIGLGQSPDQVVIEGTSTPIPFFPILPETRPAPSGAQLRTSRSRASNSVGRFPRYRNAPRPYLGESCFSSWLAKKADGRAVDSMPIAKSTVRRSSVRSSSGSAATRKRNGGATRRCGTLFVSAARRIRSVVARQLNRGHAAHR